MSMPRYEPTLEDLSKRDGRRRQQALELLIEGPRTPAELSEHWGISQSCSYKLLRRLEKKNHVRRETPHVVHCRYYITTEGMEKLKRLADQDSFLESSPEEKIQWTDLDDLGGVLEGPVALQRLVSVEDVKEIVKRVEPEDLVVEKKFDGWLVQVVSGRIYSRRGIELTANFIPIAVAAKKLDGVHWIGELVYWGPDGRMSEPEVTSIAGTDDPADAAAKMAKLPGRFQIMAFDILADEGIDISHMPFEERREILEKVIPTGRFIAHSPLYPFARWKKAYDDALAEGGEGAVFKNIRAPYAWKPLGQREARPLASQYKLKAVRSDDFVAFDFYKSDKDKLMVRFGQFWKGELVEVGEMNNFSRETEIELQELLKKGPLVMEILFQERFPKPPGKLRNPRYHKLRPDKPMESVMLPAQYAPT